MAIFNINKTATIEIENDLIKYRVPLIEYETENIEEIKKDIKRKVAEIEDENYFLTPFKVEIINSSVIYYYDVVNYKSFLYIRQLDFKEKLKYFASLIEIAKRTEKTKVTWVKENFVLDPYEERFKAITYETDFVKMKEKTKVLEGLKELILISLTNLDSIIGKPRRTNFIDQDDDVIQFAETILLKINNIEDLDSFIQTKIIEYEYEKNPKKTQQMENKKKKKSLVEFSMPKKKKKTNVSYQPPKKKNSRFTKKDIITFSVLGVVFVLALFFRFSMNGETDSVNDDIGTVITHDNNSVQSDGYINVEEIGESENDYKILTAYRLFMTGDNKKALAILEEIGYNNLNKADQKIMLSIYEKDENYVKVIELNPVNAETIVNTLIAEDKIDKVREIHEQLKIDNPYVSFEIAYIDRNWEKLLEYKDKVRLNGRKETQIIEAYIGLQMYDEAKKFAESVGNPDLLKMIEHYR